MWLQINLEDENMTFRQDSIAYTVYPITLVYFSILYCMLIFTKFCSAHQTQTDLIYCPTLLFLFFSFNAGRTKYYRKHEGNISLLTVQCNHCNDDAITYTPGEAR